VAAKTSYHVPADYGSPRVAIQLADVVRDLAAGWALRMPTMTTARTTRTRTPYQGTATVMQAARWPPWPQGRHRRPDSAGRPSLRAVREDPGTWTPTPATSSPVHDPQGARELFRGDRQCPGQCSPSWVMPSWLPRNRAGSARPVQPPGGGQRNGR